MTWALRSLCRSSRRAHLLTTRKRAVVLPAAVVRSTRETRRASLPCPVWTGQQTPTAACASGGASPMHRGLGGLRTPTSCTRYIPVHCLLLPPQPLLPQCPKQGLNIAHIGTILSCLTLINRVGYNEIIKGRGFH